MKKMVLLFAILVSSAIANGQNSIPADSVGVWAVDGNTLTRVNKITHRGIKGNGGLATVATFGIAKTKAKLEFNGQSSEHVFNGTATLRIYFGNPPMQQMTNLFMFTPAYSIKNFEVARFDVKKGKRYLTGFSVSLFGSSSGVSASDDVQIQTNEIRPGVYDIAVSGKSGEYCLMFTANGTGGFGGVFDFTIK